MDDRGAIVNSTKDSSLSAERNRPSNWLKRSFVMKMLPAAQKIPQTTTLEDIESVRFDVPHIEEATQCVMMYPNDDFGWLFSGIAFFYEGQSQWHRAEQWWIQRLFITKKRLGLNHPIVADSLNNLATLYTTTGRYLEAEPLYRRSLEIRERQLGSNHPSTATSLNNLAVLYFYQYRWTEAENMLLQSLSIYCRASGKSHPDTQRTLKSLQYLVAEAVENDCVSELSDNPITQQILQSIQEG